ncbi:MAG TPA: rhodanese-like domain-containing protein [Streptosporangiaceae bacterium]|nr:rhodanese-like domain-containing protein [Streptosporangiaceae bacterium]
MENMMSVDVVPIAEEGLGNSAYLIGLGDGRAAVVDPGRDPRPYQAEAARRRLRVAYAIETHTHADFVSGARELAACGAEVVAAAGAGLAFPHRGLRDGDELDLGGLRLTALATPGHTPAHLSYLLSDGDRPAGVFTGGALIVGGVARTDLLGPDRTEELTRAAYRSLAGRLLALPDDTPVWPTHGPGSFCSAGGTGRRTSTIGQEKAANPLLAGVAGEEEFTARLLASLGSYPGYFLRLPACNRAGPAVYGDGWPALPALGPAAFRRLLAGGAELIDVRPIGQFAAGHLPGALSIELRPQFQSWLGWLVSPDRPLAFVAGPGQDRAELVRQCLNVGYEHLGGELAGGVRAWQEAGLDVERIPLARFGALDGAAILDVRQQAEWDAGHVPGAIHIELGSLPRAEIPAGPLAVMCAHGQRSMTGASLLARSRGTAGLSVLTEDADAWSRQTGKELARA